MTGERGRRRAQSTTKPYGYEATTDPTPSSKHPRGEVEVLKLDDTPPHGTPPIDQPGGLEDHRSPSFKLRMIGNYVVERTIGRGQFGKVKLAYHKKLPDMKVAIKIINKTKLDEDTLRMIQREVHIMKHLQHPNIIRLYEVLETPRTLYLIMEYAEGGEVMDFIIAHGKIPEREAKRFFAQMLSAVQYCHSKKCCHRDLKPENLLLDSNMNVKIIDFGLSNMYVPGSLMKTFCGSPTYASPELILRKEYLGPPVDVWSMGVVLFVLICGYLPFDGHNFVDLFNKILKAQYTIPSHVSDGCVSLLERMLVVEPDQRVTIDEIKKHPWLSSVQDCLPDVTTTEITDATKMNAAILEELENLGFQREEVIHSILSNNFSDSAAMYFLLEAKRSHSRRGSTASTPTTPTTTSIPFTPNFHSPSAPSPETSPPLAAPNSALPHSKSSKDEVKRVGFNLQNEKEGKGEPREGRSSVHRRAHSEAMKEQVLKQAKAEHEKNMLRSQYSTPQTKPVNYDKEPQTSSTHTPASPSIRHSIAVQDGWNTPTMTYKPNYANNTHFASNNNNSNNNNDHDEDETTVSPSPSSKMSAIISSFKSMWRKDKDKEKEKEKEKKAHGDQPRVVRFAFHLNTMSDKSPESIVRDVQAILKDCNIIFTMKGKFCMNCLVDNVRFSIEVCRIPRLVVNGVRFSRAWFSFIVQKISGSAWKYKTIVKDLVVHMKL